MKTIEFNEVQRFRTWWAWAGAAALNLLFLYAIVQQVLLDKPFGTRPAPDAVLIGVEAFLLLVFFFLMSIKLKTRINETGIYYQFYPFQFKETKINWHEVTDIYMRHYNPLMEYGGWGIRRGSKKRGSALITSASSNIGLQLQFYDGKLLLIGTAKPDEMQVIMDTVIAAGKINRVV